MHEGTSPVTICPANPSFSLGTGTVMPFQSTCCNFISGRSTETGKSFREPRTAFPPDYSCFKETDE